MPAAQDLMQLINEAPQPQQVIEDMTLYYTWYDRAMRTLQDMPQLDQNVLEPEGGAGMYNDDTETYKREKEGEFADDEPNAFQ